MNQSYTPARLPDNEAWRLQSLRDLDVLDSAPEAEFDALVKVASLVCGVPISLISLVDADRQWFKAEVGLGARQTPRDVAFCAHAILGDQVFEVSDALQDARFAGNPLVQSAPDIRFYAGAPITLGNGARVGTLCVIDREPRQLSPMQREILQQLGIAASQALEARKVLGAQKKQAVIAAHDAAVQQAQASLQGLEHALQQARAVAATIDIHVIVSEADRQGRITHCNVAFERISGYRRDELLGQNHRIVNSGYHPRSFWDTVWRTISSGTAWRGEICNRAKDGSLYWVDSMIAPFMGADGQVEKYVSIRTDITQRKQYERELQAARSDAEAATRSKGQFLANMSHEIRTPMNAILGLLNLLQDTELTSRQRDYVNKTEGAAQSLLGLLNDILDFSKVEAGKMTLEHEPFRIDKLLRNLSVVLSATVGAKDVEVLFDIDPSLPPVVLGDALRLQQVLINLGGNAVKFTAQGQVVLGMRSLAQSDQAVTIAFSVRDTGIGIAPEHQAHIFSGFSQAEGSTTRRFGGTGLGLAISKGFVELMGGSIAIDSQPGQGSTFSFVLEMPTVEQVPQALAEAPRTVLPAQRVLVVDDNPVAGELALGMVRSWGWTAELASTGAQALEMVCIPPVGSQGFPYPVIVMDSRLPDTDGWETMRHIRQWARQHALPQPTVIMVTAHGREILAQRSEDEHAMLNGFLVKPVTASMLYEALVDAKQGDPGMRHVAKTRSRARQLSGMRILVVEDNLINQQVAEELLSAAGAMVSLAANGQIGVDAVAAAAPQFDVVLMDVQMPVLDGYGATRMIREHLGLTQLPIVAMTANAMPSDREVCLAAGMNEHIGKPFDMDRLVSLLIRVTGIVPAPASTQEATAGTEPAPPLPDVAGLDLQTALARMSGMRALYVRTAGDFVRIMDSVVAELQQLVASGERETVLMRLHTLKGNAATLGATELATMAARLEAACKSGVSLHDCSQGLAQLATLVRSTQDQLREAIAHLAPPAVAAPADLPAAVAPEVRHALHNLTALAAASDMEALVYFAEMRATLSALPGGFVDRVDEALQNIDLPAAHALCEAMQLQLGA